MKIILDSDFLISLRHPDQSTHLEAKKIFKKIKKQFDPILFCLNLCIQETATVISHKYSQKQAVDFYKSTLTNSPNIINLDPKLESLTWKIFLKQTKKNISFIDCANLVAIKHYNLDKIFSFDKFYPKTLRLC